MTAASPRGRSTFYFKPIVPTKKKKAALNISSFVKCKQSSVPCTLRLVGLTALWKTYRGKLRKMWNAISENMQWSAINRVIRQCSGFSCRLRTFLGFVTGWKQ
ncbi:hypothetical protein JOB18_038235 [Solea senegalensis]|uniref:Uncharacterized protein n=1 Tax=Solea senegalensis TaxID=28829 RepID=A0AAV6S3P1_SOLSE|nr:hypothetical protein JOB18_038235 [Solea senegalensis]